MYICTYIHIYIEYRRLAICPPNQPLVLSWIYSYLGVPSWVFDMGDGISKHQKWWATRRMRKGFKPLSYFEINKKRTKVCTGSRRGVQLNSDCH